MAGINSPVKMPVSTPVSTSLYSSISSSLVEIFIALSESVPISSIEYESKLWSGATMVTYTLSVQE